MNNTTIKLFKVFNFNRFDLLNRYLFTSLINESNRNVALAQPNESKQIIDHVNKNILTDPKRSRLFAVVMVAGSQYKVTVNDTIVVRNHFYPTIGDKIILEKVLLVGSKDFTVLGKPMLSKDIVRVEATVIEKTLTNNLLIFTYKPRRDNKKMNFYKGILTVLRINSIDIVKDIPAN